MRGNGGLPGAVDELVLIERLEQVNDVPIVFGLEGISQGAGEEGANFLIGGLMAE